MNLVKKSKYIIVLLALISVKVFAQTAKIQFSNFTLEIESMGLWEQSKLTDKFFSGDAEVDIELGGTLEGSTIKVINSKITNLTIDMSFETSITIMNEGPHCDLINWKHYTSGWTKLEQTEADTFLAKSYSEQDLQKFPEVTLDEIIKAVEEQCSGWSELARTIKSPNEYPSGVGVSRYFLRISGINNVGKRVTRLLTFNVPMGC